MSNKSAPELDDLAIKARRGRWRKWFAVHRNSAAVDQLILEIGCSDGELLHSVAQRFRDSCFVGIDWKQRSLARAAERMDVNNVALLRGRGQLLLEIFAEEELDEVWIFHPEPNDKPKELRNRLLNEAFLADVHRHLVPGGRVCIKTDHVGYYQFLLGLLGLPEPEWFSVPAGEGKRLHPKVRQKDLAARETIPARSDTISGMFQVTANSPDLWNDPAGLEAVAQRAFHGLATPYEKRFIKKHFPIYYIELRKLMPPAQ